MSKSKIHHETSASQAEEPAGLASEAAGGQTPTDDEASFRVALGPWTVTGEGLSHKGSLVGDMLFAGADEASGGLWAVFTPKGQTKSLRVDLAPAEVEGMSGRTLARYVARRGYVMAPGAENAVAGYLLACWNKGRGKAGFTVTCHGQSGTPKEKDQ